jgi:hypothetical protein
MVHLFRSHRTGPILEYEFLTTQPPELIFAVLPDGSKSLVRGSGILNPQRPGSRSIRTGAHIHFALID